MQHHIDFCCRLFIYSSSWLTNSGATDFQGLRELMQSYHEDLMSRFDQQQDGAFFSAFRHFPLGDAPPQKRVVEHGFGRKNFRPYSCIMELPAASKNITSGLPYIVLIGLHLGLLRKRLVPIQLLNHLHISTPLDRMRGRPQFRALQRLEGRPETLGCRRLGDQTINHVRVLEVHEKRPAWNLMAWPAVFSFHCESSRARRR